MSLPAVFEQYQKARTQFVQMVAELATRPQNIETLQNAGEPSACTRVAAHPWPRLARRASTGSCLPCSPVLSPHLHSWLPPGPPLSLAPRRISPGPSPSVPWLRLKSPSPRSPAGWAVRELRGGDGGWRP